MRSIKLVLATLVVLMPSVVWAQSSTFLDLTAIPVGASPSGVALGDLNGDGIPDMAVANSGDNTVSIALGNGDGSFKAPTTISVGTNPGPVAIADLNKDGKGDLVVGTTTGKSVQIFLGNGDGTFGAPNTMPAGLSIPALQIADFNGDGNLDIAAVAVDSNSTGIAILLGKGDGTFTFSTANPNAGFGSAQSPAGSLVAGDFDGNGTMDLALAATNNSAPGGFVAVFLNDGTGKITFKASSVVSGPPAGLTVGKFTGSGHLDVAVAVPTAHVAVLIGNGDGTFQAETDLIVDAFPSSVIAADLDGDGEEDIVSASFIGTLSLLRGKGDGTFQPSVLYRTLANATQLATADVNHDGHPDVVVTDATPNRAQVFLATSAGTLFTGSYPTGVNPQFIATGDVNGDGLADFAVQNADSSVSLYLADGHGGFQFSPIAPSCPSGVGTGVVIGNFQSATVPSLVAGCFSQSQFATLLARYSVDAAGNVAQVQTLPISTRVTLNVTDFDGDGISDLLLDDQNNGQVLIEYGGPAPFANTNFFLTPAASIQAVIGDYNGDGKPDILSDLGTCFVLVSGAYVAVGDNICGLAVSGDFNGDGLDDVLGSNAVAPVTVNISNGDGTFSPGVPIDSQTNTLVESVADFNGDGVLDAVLGINGGSLALKVGAADGSFHDSGTSFGPGAEKLSIPVSATGDFDNSGSADLAVVEQGMGSSQNVVDVFLNKSHFLATSSVLSQTATGAVVVGQPINLTANVSSKNGIPTGQVIFKRSGVPTATIALVGGAASSTVGIATSAGQSGFTALYTGDGTYSGSLSKRFLVTVSQAHSTTVVTGAAAPKLGVSSVYTATVTPQFSGTPGGTIQFFADGEPIGTGTLANGQATVSYAATTMGAHKIEANYSGDANFVTSLGVLSVKVGKAVSTVSVAASANPAIYGTAVTLTAKVTDSDGAVATGPVVFKEGTSVYGTVSLAAGSAQFVLPTLPIGTHKITAQYGGDTADGTANGTISLVIQGAPTTTTVTTSNQATNFGQSVTFTATITATAGSPDGTLTFKNGSAVLGTVAVSGGQAQFSVATLAAGTHTITALYNGGSAYAGSSGTLQQIVEKAATTTALTTTLNPAAKGTSVTFTATVTSGAPQGVTGNVTFKDGKTSLGTVALVNGQAQLNTALLAKGAHTVTANYAASASFAASSTTLAQTIN
jgi:hypothetical protein